MSLFTNNKNINFLIDQVAVKGDLVLAPMDGYSDLPLRAIATELGNAISITEFVNAIDVVNNHYKIPIKVSRFPGEAPFVIQVFDNDPERILSACQLLMNREPDVIDINMGCSVKNVSNRGAGAGLLRDPQKIARIFSLLTSILPVPITGKIRLGWDENSLNYLEIAKIIEDNGGKMVTVHGRTRSQKYTQPAVWQPIAEIKQHVRIPVIGNGDVTTVADIERMKIETGCDAVMIGRAAIVNPWILSRRDRSGIEIPEVSKTVFRHLNLSVEFYGMPKGLVVFRKFADRYLKPYSAFGGDIRQKILTTTDLTEFLDLLSALFAQIDGSTSNG
jgi:nifR3 family TIM-barrel protein